VLSERGTYRKIGQSVFNPETYTEGIPALVKGAGRIVKKYSRLCCSRRRYR
jgi:hypothetical protein